MNVQDIIGKALIEYDGAQPTIRYLLKNTQIEWFVSIANERDKFNFIDNATNKSLFETEVELLGVYYNKYKIWSWSWSLPGLKNSINYLSKELLMFALTLESGLSYIKSLLTTSRGIIRDDVQVDINLAISSSILKQPYVYPLVRQVDNYHLVYYYLLLNKDELTKIKEKI